MTKNNNCKHELSAYIFINGTYYETCFDCGETLREIKDISWKDIEEEFKNRYLLRGIPGYEMRHVQMCEDMLEFFKPYFQELEEKAWMYDQLCK